MFKLVQQVPPECWDVCDSSGKAATGLIVFLHGISFVKAGVIPEKLMYLKNQNTEHSSVVRSSTRLSSIGCMLHGDIISTSHYENFCIISMLWMTF